MIQVHITECKKRINVISNTGFSKSNVGKRISVFWKQQ